jgi:hypothetical protein
MAFAQTMAEESTQNIAFYLTFDFIESRKEVSFKSDISYFSGVNESIISFKLPSGFNDRYSSASALAL